MKGCSRFQIPRAVLAAGEDGLFFLPPFSPQKNFFLLTSCRGVGRVVVLASEKLWDGVGQRPDGMGCEFQFDVFD
jgi:hypothetical protein